MLSERVLQGTAAEKTRTVDYVESVQDGTFQVYSVPFQKVAAILPMTPQFVEDKAAFDSYIDTVMPVHLRRGVDDLLVKTMVDRGVPQTKYRFWQTNKRAILQARKRVFKRVGGEVGEPTWLSDNRAVVGVFKEAQTFQQGGIAVEMSNSHEDFFIRGWTAVRGEMRVAAVVYRPSAFEIVTLRPRRFRPLWRKIKSGFYRVDDAIRLAGKGA